MELVLFPSDDRRSFIRVDKAMAQRFHAYFLFSSLESAGWPRKTSLFGAEGVPAEVLDAVWLTTVQAATGLGAGRPYRACQIITQLFTPDWKTVNGDDWLAELDPAKIVHKRSDVQPWEALISATRPSLPSGFLKWKLLIKSNFFDYATVNFSHGLLFGLLHPVESGDALSAERARYRTDAPGMVKAGLDIPLEPAWADNAAYFAWLEQTVAEYEEKVGLLPPPAAPLLAAAAVQSRLS